ncbi:MAG: alpha/beta fold hydrolase, partial [Mycobacteriales bacterium]
DLPGHGDSDPLPASPPTRRALAESALQVAREFGLTRYVLVGASLGGLAAISLTAHHPEAVAGLVLVDVGHRLEEAGVQRVIAFLGQHESFASLEEAAAAVAGYLPHRPAGGTANLTRNLRQRSDGRWVWKHGMSAAGANSPAGQAAAGGWRSILDGVAEEAAQVGVPALVLRGRDSDVLSPEGAREIAGLLPRGRLALVSGAGHLVAGDNPASTTDLVRTFLAEVGW